MPAHITSARELDIVKFEIEMEVEAIYQKWLAEWEGSRLAHKPAGSQPGTFKPPVQPSPEPQAGY